MGDKKKKNMSIRRWQFLASWFISGWLVFLLSMTFESWLYIFTKTSLFYTWASLFTNSYLDFNFLGLTYGLVVGVTQMLLMKQYLGYTISGWWWKTWLGAIGSGLVGLFFINILPEVSNWLALLLFLIGISVVQYMMMRADISKAWLWIGSHISGAIVIVVPQMLYDLISPPDCFIQFLNSDYVSRLDSSSSPHICTSGFGYVVLPLILLMIGISVFQILTSLTIRNLLSSLPIKQFGIH